MKIKIYCKNCIYGQGHISYVDSFRCDKQVNSKLESIKLNEFTGLPIGGIPEQFPKLFNNEGKCPHYEKR